MPNEAVRIISIIGLIILLILGAWGIVVVGSKIPGILSSIGHGVSSPFGTSTPATSTSPTTERMIVTAPTDAVESGKQFTLAWTHEGGTSAGQYGFMISYSCMSGLSIDAPLPTGTTRSVPCNTPFNYTNAQSQITLIPHVAGTKNLTTQFTVRSIALATGSTTAAGSASATFAPKAGAATNPPSTPNPRPVVHESGYASNPSGVADLAVRIVSAAPGSVQFEIKNIGTKTAPWGWTFTATLPINGSYVYNSVPQQALTPQSGIVYTMNYGGGSQGCSSGPAGYWGNYYPQNQNCWNTQNYRAVTIVADPAHLIWDANWYNNTATAGAY